MQWIEPIGVFGISAVAVFLFAVDEQLVVVIRPGYAVAVAADDEVVVRTVRPHVRRCRQNSDQDYYRQVYS